jgi:hypothetical protein
MAFLGVISSVLETITDSVYVVSPVALFTIILDSSVLSCPIILIENQPVNSKRTIVVFIISSFKFIIKKSPYPYDNQYATLGEYKRGCYC